MEYLYPVTYTVVGILLIWLFIKLFAKPIKWIFKLLINAVIGFVMLFVFNYLGSFVGITLSVGWVSAIVAGVLGIPGILLLLLLENFF